MYGRQPLNELQLLTCSKCGAPQESPGSTVCELCGADLVRHRDKRSSSTRQVPRLKHFFRGPVRLFARGLAALQLLVFLVFRGVTLLLLLASLVLASSLVPEVNALVPATKEIAAPVRQMLQQARDWGGKLLANWEAGSQPRQPMSESTIIPPKLPPAHVEAIQAVIINSTPGGATVRVNSRIRGKTPLTLKLAAGTYKVTISRPGFATVSRTIIVKQGKVVSIGVSLAVVGPSPTQPAPEPKQPRDTQQQHKQQGEGP